MSANNINVVLRQNLNCLHSVLFNLTFQKKRVLFAVWLYYIKFPGCILYVS